MVDKGSKRSSNKTSSKKRNSNSKIKNNKTKIENTKIKSQTTTRKGTNNKVEKVPKKEKNTKKIVILTIFIIIALFIIGASYIVLKTPKFNITAISVVGNNKVDINSIITNSGIKIGDNVVQSIFNIDKKNIFNIPYISNVKASVKFPSEFVIKVTERKSIYYAYDKEKNVYYRLDENGIILEVCNDLSLKGQELLVNGITFDSVVNVNTKINDIDYSKILVYRKIEEEFANIFPDKNITKVNFENSLTKIYINDKIEVILPNDTNLKYNLTFLKDIVSNVGDIQGTIDMTKENPTFVNF